MTSKRANWLFLTMILIHIGVVLSLTFFGDGIGIILNFFLGQAISVGPALAFLAASRFEDAAGQQHPLHENAMGQPPAQPVRRGRFRCVKFTTLLMIVLCTFLLMPLVVVLNALSLFFTDNAVASMQGDILSVSFPVMLFMIGIFGPFCEEFVFRGVLYESYANRRAGIAPILLSAFLFGLMHMNFNQALYAFAIGIFFAFLVEAAGSLWASAFCHMVFNSIQVVTMYLSKAALGNAYMEVASNTAETLSNTQIAAALSVYLIIAAVTTPIAVCCIVWIAKNEGRQEAFRALFRRTKGETPQEPLLTTPLIVAVVVALGYMSMELFMW
ncbi:MAG: CPBP family intramembrane metalloprotease [Bacteroidales bacterium]|nr:CPBP family intramembrane metalloprotease [Bacteroidales bacterium]MCM1416781.1 CPBP family intramembrane metalloprotease [bacterium]